MVASLTKSMRSCIECVSGVSGRGEEEVEQDVEVGKHEGEEWMMVRD